VSNDEDCDDDDDDVNPDSLVFELPDDGVDQNCDGQDGCHDLDCDGLPDLVFASRGGDESHTLPSPVWLGTGGSLAKEPGLELPTRGASRVIAQDLNGDGWQDLAFANFYDGQTSEPNSQVFWGSAAGFSEEASSELASYAPLDALAADLDLDGWPELVLSSSATGDSDEASIYWGSATGFGLAAPSHLPTTGTYRVLASDLDGDGWQELVFCSHQSSRGYEAKTYAYWNLAGSFWPDELAALDGTGSVDVVAADLDGDGLQEILLANHYDGESYELSVTVNNGVDLTGSDVAELPALGASDLELADLNQDGFLDLVVANYRSDETVAVDSEVYWGSASGLSADEHTPLPTEGAMAVEIADLDGDGWLDLVFANYYGLTGLSTESTIYWGSETGYSEQAASSLPTVGAVHVLAADVDLDGWPDLVFNCYTDGMSLEIPSLIYYGSKGGFSEEHRDELVVGGAWGPAVLVGQP